MLQAFKNDTLTDLQVRTLSIREKELNFWNMCLSAMAKQGALIAGFTYGGLNHHFPPETSPMLILTYLVITVLAMSCELVTVTIATFCSMFGPGLALRGPEGAISMHKAVDVMQEYARASFNVFMTGLVCFHLSSILMMWFGQPTFISVITNIVLIAFLVLFFKNGYEIHSKLYVHQEKAVSGKFENFAGYEDMPDLDGGRSKPKEEEKAQELPEQPKSSFMWMFS